MMIKALLLAFEDLLSPPFRKVLIKSVILTLALFIVVMVGVEWLVSTLYSYPWPWVEALAAVGTGLVLLVAFFFMMAPVSAMFAGLYLDQIAELVEKTHYPLDPPGVPLKTIPALVLSLKFTVLVLVVNLAVLPTVLIGIGAVALVIANAYLLSREYFEMVAARHMPMAAARELRRSHTPYIFIAGLVPALLTLIPLLSLLVPLFATSFFEHIFKQMERPSV